MRKGVRPRPARPVCSETALGFTLRHFQAIVSAAEAIAGDMPECSSADPRRVLISHDRRKWARLVAAVEGQLDTLANAEDRMEGGQMRLTRAGLEAVRAAASRRALTEEPLQWARECARSLVHMRAVPQSRDQWRITVGLAPEVCADVDREDLTDVAWMHGALEHDPMRRADALRVQRALREVIAAQITKYRPLLRRPSRLDGRGATWH